MLTNSASSNNNNILSNKWKVIGIVVSKNSDNILTFDLYNKSEDKYRYCIFQGYQSFMYNIDPKESEDYTYIDDINVITALVRAHNSSVIHFFADNIDIEHEYYPIEGYEDNNSESMKKRLLFTSIQREGE